MDLMAPVFNQALRAGHVGFDDDDDELEFNDASTLLGH